MLKTALCDLFGVEYPIFQGGMAWLATAELAACVSETGGLGVVCTGNTPPEFMEQQVIRTREMTSMPSGVKIMLMSPFATDIKVSIVPTEAGNPGIHVPRFKEAGIKVMPVKSSAEPARHLEHIRVDATGAEGMESGGHVGIGSFYAGVVECDIEMGSLITEQVYGSIKEIKSVHQNIHDIIAEANAIMAGLSATPQGVS